MEIIIFSGQTAFTKEVTKLIKSKKLKDTCFVAESAGHETEELADFYYKNGTKVFVARGQNYDILKNRYDIPIVNVRCTYEEILLAYREARVNSYKIAILGYGSVFEMIKRFKRISKECFLSIEIEDVSNVVHLVHQAVENGIDTFIGGISTKKACDELGVRHVMLEIDKSSIESALYEALHLLDIQAERDKNFRLIQTILDSTSEAVIGFDQNRKVHYINTKAKKIISRLSLTNMDGFIFDDTYSKVFKDGEYIRDKLIEICEEKFILQIKPLKNEKTVHGAVVYLKTAAEVITSENSLRKQLNKKGHIARKEFRHIIGTSERLTKVIEWAKKIALSENTVLISGESGTGKELFAQSIHNYSSRKNGPFIAINCAALSSSVLESELFGYTKGAFTGANSEGRMGIFELAHHGTVFLDEIGEISMEVQAKLLRVLQEKEIVRVGGENVIPVDVRIITATNRNLRELSTSGKFRGDLFYRLAILELKLPSLSERKEDIPLIAANYIYQNYPNIHIDNNSLDYFKNFKYVGNIRQLINLIERCVVMSNHSTIYYHTVKDVCAQEFDNQVPEMLSEINYVFGKPASITDEKEMIRKSLLHNIGNRKKTAKELGISTTTLWRKLKKYNLLDGKPELLK
ncbi:sigma 54-interacting transcriptional regulator [Neobacillus sp. LXY-4]|uniref:sigma 54-interacting transcriptional regulator n=1 Tax=Neobacillus sp. LXY-4 TaxID=3379826 RepID=UPI003EE03314